MSIKGELSNIEMAIAKVIELMKQMESEHEWSHTLSRRRDDGLLPPARSYTTIVDLVNPKSTLKPNVLA